MRRLLAFGLVLALAVAVGGVFLLAVGTDEAWILLSVRGLLQPPDPAMAVNATLTSGGLFTLVQVLLVALGVDTLVVQRMVSLVCALAAAGLVALWLRRRGQDAGGILLVLACTAAAPGALVLASLAHAEMAAFLLLVAFVVVWEATRGRPAGRVLGSGALLGLLLATRTTAVALLPALLLWSLLEPRRRSARFREALGTVLVGAGVGAAAVVLHLAAASESSVPSAAHTLGATGLASLWPDYPRLLNKWVVAERMALLPWLTAATLGSAWAARTTRRGWAASWTLLVVFAWASWLLWLLRAPIPHLRYLWPALGGLALASGMVLAALRRPLSGAEPSWLRLLPGLFALACLVGALGAGVRHLVHGQTDVLSWEWSGEAPLDRFRAFEEVRDQRRTAEFLAARVRPGEEVAVFGQPFALRYLSGRRVRSVDAFLAEPGPPAKAPAWLVLSPTNLSHRLLRASAVEWVESSCELVAQFGSYAVYRVQGGWPEDRGLLEAVPFPKRRHPLAGPRFGTGSHRAPGPGTPPAPDAAGG